MAENRIFNIPVSFPIEELMESLVMSYSGKGYSVQENKLGNTSAITISKNCLLYTSVDKTERAGISRQTSSMR